MKIAKQKLIKLIREFLDTSIQHDEELIDLDIEDDTSMTQGNEDHSDLSSIKIPEPDYEAAQKEILIKMAQRD